MTLDYRFIVGSILIVCASACSSNGSDPVSDKPACVYETPLDDTYEAKKTTVVNEQKWLRDGETVTLKTRAPLRFPAPTSYTAGRAEFVFSEGRLQDAMEVGEKPFCVLEVVYSASDFNEAVAADEKGLVKYPDLVLTPTKLRLSLIDKVEFTNRVEAGQVERRDCPAKPQLSTSKYLYAAESGAELPHEDGKSIAVGHIGQVTCYGQNMKGSSLIEVLGADVVEAVEL